MKKDQLQFCVIARKQATITSSGRKVPPSSCQLVECLTRSSYDMQSVCSFVRGAEMEPHFGKHPMSSCLHTQTSIVNPKHEISTLAIAALTHLKLILVQRLIGNMSVKIKFDGHATCLTEYVRKHDSVAAISVELTYPMLRPSALRTVLEATRKKKEITQRTVSSGSFQYVRQANACTTSTPFQDSAKALIANSFASF